MKALKKVVRGVTLAELWATALTFVIMVVCYFISVVNRNFIKGSMPWTEELALYCMVYMALIGTELGLRDGTQVSVTALTEKLKGTMVGKVINFIAKVALIVFSCTMLRYSVALVAKQMSAGQTTPVMKVPMYVIYISLGEKNQKDGAEIIKEREQKAEAKQRKKRKGRSDAFD